MGYGLEVVRFKLGVVGCELQVVGCELKVVGCELEVVECRLKVVAYKHVEEIFLLINTSIPMIHHFHPLMKG